MKAEGVKPGVPDLCLPVPRAIWHGLYIEMKRATGGTVSADQIKWTDFLRRQGYYIAVAHGAEVAKQILRQYIKMKPYGEE